MSEQFKQFTSRGWFAIQWALLLSVFSYYFVENFVLSSGWEVLPLRSIDDFAMHDSIRRMQEALLSGRTRDVLTFFDYGYGNIFWLANAIAFMPLYFIDNAPLQIVLGRQVSLLFVFGSIFLVGRIAERLHPQARPLKLPIMLALACAPMIAIIGTKFHVNAQCIFFGVLAYHTLMREGPLSTAVIGRVATLSGIAVGLKLTALFMLPLIVTTLWTRLAAQGEIDIPKTIRGFCMRFGVTAAACTVPALLLFPFFIRELGSTYRTFQMYKNMGADFGGDVGPLASVMDTIAYSVHPAAFAVMAILFVVLARADWKQRRYISAILGLSVLAVYAFVCATVNKAPLYIATYALSVSLFAPLGLLGLAEWQTSEATKNMTAMLIVMVGAVSSMDFRDRALSYHRFFEIEKSTRVVEQLSAIEGMKKAIGHLTPPLRVYQDSTTVFPATRFTKGVEVVYFYGDLRNHTVEKLGRFDYVALNPDDYIFKLTPGSAEYAAASESEKAKALGEEAARMKFRETGVLGDSKYRLIYQGHQALLYEIVKP